MSNSSQLDFIQTDYLPVFVGQSVLPQLYGSANRAAIDHVSLFFLEKATRHLEAVCTLCRHEFGEDALILGRTMLEHCLYLEHIAAGADAEQRRIRAESFVYDGDRQRVEKLKELEALKAAGKSLSWIAGIQSSDPAQWVSPEPPGFQRLPNLKAIATGLGGEWESYYHFVYWSVSKLAHPSGLGSHTYKADPDSEGEVSRALALAFPMHAYLTRTVLDLLGRADLFPVLDERMSRFINLDSQG